MVKKIIIDCDPGHDDIIATLVALANEEKLEILGFTTVAGNNTLPNVTNNILKVLDYLDLDYPVCIGYDKPMKKEAEPQYLAHGMSGMDGPILDEPVSKPSSLSAIEFMKQCLLQEDKVTIVGIGPLTNIAYLIKQYPELHNKIEEIVIMGGSIYSGNIQVKSEFNIYHDPEAAKIVFNAKIPLTMAGLEVCDAGGFKLTDIEIFNNQNKVSKLVYDLLKFYSNYSVEHHLDKTTIFDMTTIIYLLNPDIFSYKMLNVDIELDGEYTRGMTVCEEISEYSIIKNPIKVLHNVENKPFTKIFVDAIKKLDERYK